MCKKPETVLEALRTAEMAVIDAMIALNAVENDESVICETHAMNIAQVTDRMSKVGGMCSTLAERYREWRQGLLEPVKYLDWVEKLLERPTDDDDDIMPADVRAEVADFVRTERARIAAATN